MQSSACVTPALAHPLLVQTSCSTHGQQIRSVTRPECLIKEVCLHCAGAYFTSYDVV